MLNNQEISHKIQISRFSRKTRCSGRQVHIPTWHRHWNSQSCTKGNIAFLSPGRPSPQSHWAGTVPTFALQKQRIRDGKPPG